MEDVIELLFDQLFGKFAHMNKTDNEKRAVIRTVLSNYNINNNK